MIGLFIMLCWSVPARAIERRNRKVIAGVAAAAAVMACAALSRVQVRYWKDSETLFRRALDVTRDNWLAQDGLGVVLEQSGRIPEAIGHLKEALQIKPDFAEAHYNLGVALMATGRMPEAIEQFEQALRINPNYAEAHCNLGIALGQAGRIPEAIGHLKEALRIKPDSTPAQTALAQLQTRR